MLRVLGGSSPVAGITRRDLLRAGTLAALIPWTTAAATPQAAKTKSVILLDLFGGPSHIDTFDPKPAAPVEIRGEFGSIATTVPGVRVSEHLPRMARWLHRVSLIRSLSHSYNSHNPYAVMTGYTGGSDRVDYFSKP